METLWGSGKDLTALQMGVRALAIFFITLALVRLSGRRSFGRKTAFDNIIVIILGAVLSRPLVGVSPFWPCVAGATVMSVIHRLIGIAKWRWGTVERIVAGKVDTLWHDGKLEPLKMARHEISVSDLDAAARASLNVPSHDQVPEIRIETNGELTVVRR